jgi:hypothetical protein
MKIKAQSISESIRNYLEHANLLRDLGGRDILFVVVVACGWRRWSLVFFLVVLLHAILQKKSSAEQIIEELEAVSRQHRHAYIQGRTFRHVSDENPAHVHAAAKGVELDGFVLRDDNLQVRGDRHRRFQVWSLIEED